MSEYKSIYARMTDDQLLNLANDPGSFSPEALVALNSELSRRNFGRREIEEQADGVRRLHTEWDNRGDLSRSLNGFGTSIYGKRDFQRDGSFITTRWFILFWIPVIPLRSYRVRKAGAPRATLLGWSQSYVVLAGSRPDVRQVFNVYSFMAAPFIGLSILNLIKAGSAVATVALVLWVFIPFALRELAMTKLPQR